MACLLGSGVSRTADIPTGWEIVVDLTGKLAVLEGSTAQGEQELLKWFRTRYGHEPDYSELIERLAPHGELQRGLLEPYFTELDPATEERKEREPTAAHHAIARLVSRGLLRVIITTNFDRLMETALRQAGVANIEVVSTDAQAANCLPFHAAQAFVLKIHGDWRDVTLRNSPAALANYPSALGALLRRILDEHGLIVCGWSAEYDGALRNAIEQYNRRFPVYWVGTNLKDRARALTDSLRAYAVSLRADEFFTELEAGVSALERLGPPKRLAAEALLVKARRAIDLGSQQQVEALLFEATRDVTAWLAARTNSAPTTAQDLAEQLEAARRASEPLCKLAALLAQGGASTRTFGLAMSRLLAATRKRQAWNKITDPIACYPSVLLGFTWGVMQAVSHGWQGAVESLVDTGARLGDLAFPPGSNKHMSPFRLPPHEDRYKQSPQEFFGDFTCTAVFGFCEEWIVREGAFVELYDKVDLLIAIRSARIGEWWVPRLLVSRGIDGTFDASKRLIDGWLVELLEKDDALRSTLFSGIDNDWRATLDRLKAFAADEQIDWRA
jgi:hypothetical protein